MHVIVFVTSRAFNEWQYHGVSMCEDGNRVSMCEGCDGCVRVVIV